MASLVSGQAYRKRQVPSVAKDADGKAQIDSWAQRMVAWLAEEFGYIQQATLRDATLAAADDVTLLGSEGTVLANATGGAFDVTLPDAADAPNSTITIIRTNGGGNAVTVVGTVSGAVDPTLGSQYASLTVRSAGSGTSWAWYEIASA